MANKNTIKNITTALPGVLVIALIAGVLTYGGQKAVAEATKAKPVVVKTVTVTKAEDPKDSASSTTNGASTTSSTGSSAATSSTTTTTPAPAPTTPTATTNSFVYLRPTASTSGTALKGLNAGTVVQYTTKTTTAWQKVTVDGVSGYVYKKWLTY